MVVGANLALRSGYESYKGPIIHVVDNTRHGGSMDYRTDVRVMTIAEGYAMVRRKGCAPYVAPLKELFFHVDS